MDLRRFFEKRGFRVESISEPPITIVIDKPIEAAYTYHLYSESHRTPVKFVQAGTRDIPATNKVVIKSRLKKCLSTIQGFLKFKKKG